jgi:microcystin-dependent protein
MSDQLVALEELADDNITAWFRLSAISQAVLFYATNYLTARKNWINFNNPEDEVTNEDWDIIQAYTDGLLYEAKNPMIGLIISYVTAEPAPNVLPCDGATYNRVDYPNLYDLLDSFFIIDGDTFKVPDLRGKTVIGSGDGGGSLTSRSIGDEGGEELHQLSESELASHSHSVHSHGTSTLDPAGIVLASTVSIFDGVTGSAGGDVPHNNMQPFYTLNYGIIAS